MKSHAKSSAEAPATVILTFNSQNSLVACPHNFFCRLRRQLEVFWIIFFFSKHTAVGIRDGLCDSGGKNQQSKLQAKRKKGKELRKTSYKGKHIVVSKAKQKMVTHR